jgi:hypothetical protein
VRDLEAVVGREKAQLGVLISMDETTSGMRAEAASHGFYQPPWSTKHPRIQLITVGQLLEGKKLDYPSIAGANVTYRHAARAKDRADQLDLGLDEATDSESSRGTRTPCRASVGCSTVSCR